MYDVYCKLRDSKGITDYEVSRYTGLNPSTFADWKKGKSAPKTEKLLRIARYFGVTLEYLVSGEGEEMLPGMPTIAQERENTPILWELLEEGKKANTDDLKAVLSILKRFNAYAQKAKG